jgi:hypothetical protein
LSTAGPKGGGWSDSIHFASPARRANWKHGHFSREAKAERSRLRAAIIALPRSVRLDLKMMPVVGFLNGGTAEGYAPMVAAFCQGLNEAGYVEGRNVAIEYRWARGQYDRLPSLAADLVQQKVTVIAATTTPAALAAKAATSTVPIVFTTGGDPVELGLVASLNRPGRNLTGVTNLNVEVVPKRLELARELFPGATTVALLVNPANPVAATVSKDLQAVADTLGVRLHVLHASTEAAVGCADNRSKSNRLMATASARSRSGASTEPRYSPRLRMMMTRQLRSLAAAGLCLVIFFGGTPAR